VLRQKLTNEFCDGAKVSYKQKFTDIQYVGNICS